MSTKLRMDPDGDMNARGGFGQQAATPVPLASTKASRRHRTVLVLVAVFKYSVALAQADVMAVNRSLGKIKRHSAMHGDRTLAWILETNCTAAEVMQMARPALERDCIANAWAFTPGADISPLLPLDPLHDRVVEAWSSVRDWNRSLGRLPDTMLASSRAMPDGRGVIATRILDDHPLQHTLRRRRR